MNRIAQEHELMCHPEVFGAITRGEKVNELRMNDRDFRVGDVLLLYEYDPNLFEGFVTGAYIRAGVSYVGDASKFGAPEGFVTMSIVPFEKTGPEGGYCLDGPRSERTSRPGQGQYFPEPARARDECLEGEVRCFKEANQKLCVILDEIKCKAHLPVELAYEGVPTHIGRLLTQLGFGTPRVKKGADAARLNELLDVCDGLRVPGGRACYAAEESRRIKMETLRQLSNALPAAMREIQRLQVEASKLDEARADLSRMQVVLYQGLHEYSPPEAAEGDVLKLALQLVEEMARAFNERDELRKQLEAQSAEFNNEHAKTAGAIASEWQGKMQEVQALLDWHKLYVRPPKDPNQPRSIAGVFQELENLTKQRDGARQALDEMTAAGNRVQQKLELAKMFVEVPAELRELLGKEEYSLQELWWKVGALQKHWNATAGASGATADEKYNEDHAHALNDLCKHHKEVLERETTKLELLRNFLQAKTAEYELGTIDGPAVLQQTGKVLALTEPAVPLDQDECEMCTQDFVIEARELHDHLRERWPRGDFAPRAIVKWFGRQMEVKLRENDHKEGWLGCAEEFLLDKLDEELDELKRAVKDCAAALITEECADLANIAMMLADISGSDLAARVEHADTIDTDFDYDGLSPSQVVKPAEAPEHADTEPPPAPEPDDG